MWSGTNGTGGGKPTDSALCESSRWEATDAVPDYSTGFGVHARLPRRTEERAAMIRLLKHLIGTTLIALALVPFAFVCPVLFLLAKDPDARIAVVFAAPFSAAVLTIFYAQLSACPWRRGRA